MNRKECALVEILDASDNPSPLLPGYTDKEDGTPWTWGEWCSQSTKSETMRGSRAFIGAGTFADMSMCITVEHDDEMTAGGIVLIHPEDLPPEVETLI